MEKIYILSGRTSRNSENTESTVLGTYSSPTEMRIALDLWHTHETPLSHYFYDVRGLNGTAEWTNDQSAIYPSK
jgi:hypothetical protein